MKKYLTYCLFCIFCISATYCFADEVSKNDLIITTQSEKIEATILEVSETEIRYKKSSNPTGPTFVMGTDKIVSILYKNGEVQIFSNKPSSTSQVQYANPSNNSNISQGSIKTNHGSLGISCVSVKQK